MRDFRAAARLLVVAALALLAACTSVQPTTPGGSTEEAAQIASATERYRLAFVDAAIRTRSAPPRVPGMEGEARVTVRLTVGEGGQIASLVVLRSSGYDRLDQEAIEAVRRTKALVRVPATLEGRTFSIDLPFVFVNPGSSA